MKNIWLVFMLACGLAFPSFAENAPRFTPIEIYATDDFSDLTEFGNAIATKNIIYLDELTHGEHEVFALKARLVKYLHQHHGFSALIIESGLFDVQELVKQASQSAEPLSASLARGNIFFAYAADPAFRDLLDYIDSKRHSEQPLHFAGFDGRLSGAFSVQRFVKQLVQHVAALPEAELLMVDWAAYATLLQNTLERRFTSLTQQEVEQHIAKTYLIIDALQAADKVPAMDSASYYARLLEGVLRLFEVQYQKRRFDEHDLVMANNVHWLLEHVYPQQKVIIWGHNVHVNRQGYLALRANNITTALDKAYGKQSYIVNFAGLSGAYRDYVDGKVKALPTLNAEHLAYHMQNEFRASPQAIFLQPQDFTAPKYADLVLHGHNYEPTFQIRVKRWRNHFDSIFLINTLSPSQP